MPMEWAEESVKDQVVTLERVEACDRILDRVETSWTDLRPASLVRAMGS